MKTRNIAEVATDDSPKPSAVKQMNVITRTRASMTDSIFTAMLPKAAAVKNELPIRPEVTKPYIQ